MRRLLALPKLCLLCALIGFGALSSCTSTAPDTVPTLTLIPNTATSTPTPITPVPTSTESPTPVSLTQTPNPQGLEAIISTTITPDVDLVRSIVNDLATHLEIPSTRIQFVSVERVHWIATLSDEFGCVSMAGLDSAWPMVAEASTGKGYRYLLLVGNTVYEYHADEQDRFQPCEFTRGISDDMLLAVDPVAVDIVQLVKQRVATDLDLSTRRVQLAEITPYIWSDTSLGCPISDQTYTQSSIPGYRVVVVVGGNDLAFHSDSSTVIPCPAGQEKLPE